jgi:hypothetical protein
MRRVGRPMRRRGTSRRAVPRYLLISEEANQTAADFVRAKIAEIVTDPRRLAS